MDRDRHTNCCWVSQVHGEEAGRLSKVNVLFCWEETPWLQLSLCPSVLSPPSRPALLPHPHTPPSVVGVHCHQSQSSPLKTLHFLRLTALCSPCLDFLCSQFFSSCVWLFPHLSSPFFSHQFLYWAQLAYILLSICPNHNPASSFSK